MRKVAFTRDERAGGGRSNGLPFWKMVLAAALLAAAAIFSAWTKLSVVKLGYDIAALEKENGERQAEQEKLKLRISALRASARLEKAGREMLGLGPARAEQIVGLDGKRGSEMAGVVEEK